MFNYEIITYGGGNVLNGVFEALARMRGANIGNSVFSGLIIIAVLCAYVIAFQKMFLGKSVEFYAAVNSR